MAKTKRTNKKQKETKAQKLSGIVKSCRKIMRKDKGLNGDADRLPMLTWMMFLKFLDDNEQMQEVNAELKGKKYKPAIASPYRWRDWAKDVSLTGDDLLNFINNEKVTLADGEERTGLFYYLRSLQSESGTERKDVISTVFRGVTNRMNNGYLLRDVVNKIDEIHFTNNEEINTLSHLYESILKEMRDASGDAGEFYTPRPVVKFMVEMLNPQIGESVLDPASGTGGFLVEAFDYLKKQAQTVEQREILQKQSVYGGEAKSLPFLLCQMNLLLHGLEYPNIDSGNSLRFPLREIGDNGRYDVIITNPPFAGEEEKGILNNFPNDKQSTETAWLFLQLIMRRLRRKTVKNSGGRSAVVVPASTLFDTTGIATRIKQELLNNFNLHTIIRFPKGVFEPYTDIETNILFFDTSGSTQKIDYYSIEPPQGRKNFTKTDPITTEHFNDLKEWLTNRMESESAWSVNIKDLDWEMLNLDIKNPKSFKKLKTQSPDSLLTSINNRTAKIEENLSKLTELLKERDLNNNSKEYQLNDLLIRRKDSVIIDDDKEYKRITIRSKGLGIEIRDILNGDKIGTKKQFLVEVGQLVLSKIDARSGAFGILPKECDGAIITGNFWAYDINTTLVNPKFLKLIITSHKFLNFCKASSTGTTNRKYLDESKFLSQIINIPNIETQQQILSIMESINNLSLNFQFLNENTIDLKLSLINEIV